MNADQNLLAACAQAYSSLLKCEYLYIIGRRGHTREIRLRFPEAAFHHLAGFHYLDGDDRFARKGQALRNVITQRIRQEDIALDGKAVLLAKRWEAMVHVHGILGAKAVFHYLKNGPAFSNIRARYMMTVAVSECSYLLFLNGKTDDDLIPCSILTERDEARYRRNAAVWTTLQITRVELDSGAHQVLYQSPSFNHQFMDIGE